MFKKIFSSSEEQKEKSLFKEESEFSAFSKSLDKQTTETQTKLWLNQNYPSEQRKQIKFLEISEKGLSGLLDLTDFVSLEELYCYSNQLTGIEFADSTFNKLRVLHVGNNQFPAQDLSLFGRFIKLEVLNLQNSNFTGDLELLKDLVNLRSLDISDTNVESGLIHLSDQLESLFCRVEKKVRCQKISEELKDYELGHDCYDFQAWKKDESWLIMPGSWPKSKVSEKLENLETELLSKEKRFFALANSVYQGLVLVEEKEKSIAALLEKEIEELKEGVIEGNFTFSDFKEEQSLDPQNLVLVAEKYLLTSKKMRELEEEIKKLRQNNRLLEEKNEFWKFLQLELAKQNEETIINSKLKDNSLLETDNKNKFKNKNINIKNTMTNNTNTNQNNKNEKIFILEWESAELKDRTMRYENFKVITGGEKENLLFYSTFFVDNFKFKKGEIYQLSTPGSFVEDTSGTIPGGFDASGIIQGIDNGGYEFEKVFPSLMIKELWEEKEENREKWDLSEKDLEQKIKDVSKTNQELLTVRKELSDLQNKFSNLQLGKDGSDKKLNEAEENLKKEKEDNEKNKQKLTNSENEVSRLKNQLANLQKEKDDMEVKWVSPEKEKQSQKEKENLNKQLKKERREKQKLLEMLKESSSQGLKDNIEKKLEEKKKAQEVLKVEIEGKLGNQAHLLESLLEKQENFDLVVFDENISQKSKIFLLAQDKLQEIKGKLVAKISPEEIEEFCRIQIEISKLEIQQKQWKEMEDKQEKEQAEQFEFEASVSTPPTTPRR